MKKSLIASLFGAGLIVSAVAPVSAYAVDGIINFSGSISDTMCDINGQAPGEGNVTNVDLGNIDPDTFKAVGNESSFKDFSLVLSGAGCTTGKKVNVAFDTETNIDKATGNLKLVGPSEAQGVQIQIYNNAGSNSKIVLGAPETSPQQATIAANAATLKYRASYVSTAATVTPGTGLSHIRYVLAYE
ncbi:MAG: putative major fimbrial subunit LpfA [Pseudomonas sp.]|nr:MAG: putative major fimbrial subunit LpfA [Pseudomonas sp.]